MSSWTDFRDAAEQASGYSDLSASDVGAIVPGVVSQLPAAVSAVSGGNSNQTSAVSKGPVAAAGSAIKAAASNFKFSVPVMIVVAVAAYFLIVKRKRG